ncbi:MAG TPA: lytic murein transglycosylase [Solirubrobacterales bacterium]|nr:lytic murein transglycosylase [Solirubrobacterales bacterium]
MSHPDKIRALAATAAATVALAAPFAASAMADEPVTAATPLEEPAEAFAPAPVQQGTTLAPPPAAPTAPPPAGGVAAGTGAGPEQAASGEEGGAPAAEGALPVPSPATVLPIPSLPSSSCAATGVPPILVPMYQRAAAAYGLGPQGPAVLAGINLIETAFGTNLNVSSAGAQGWMQFMPETWAGYGVDASGDGVADPYNPEDAIFAAANYLSASGMPADTYGAIFAYNHADWYVADVLANAACYADDVGAPALTDFGPRLLVLKCTPAPAWRERIPHEYLRAFEDAAARYELGKRGVWALAAIAHLESDFGRGMSKEQLRSSGPLGLDASEWRAYGVDGDGDGRIRHADPVDSAATLARLIWSRGSLSAGVFTHNQAEWYVQEVLQQADAIEGECKARYVDWALAPLATGLETPGPSAVLQPSGQASAPEDAPAAVKAAIAAANSIASTPYVWGGGHGSWYSYGYDCSGAVSFALYGAGLLDTPLVSGSLAGYGEPGPGKWITIYANGSHTYAVIAGLRWDTAGNPEGVSGPRWHTEPPYPEGFEVRHPAGY